MGQTRKPRGVRATQEGLQKLQQAKAAKRNDKGKPWTYFDVATAAEVDEKTVQRFFRGEAKDRNYAIAITNALDLEITQVVDPKEWNPPEQTSEAINWREVCGKVLAQQRENQNFRRSITGRHLGHEAKNVYVKLGLVKPKGQPRRSYESQPSADRGMLQYQLTETEIEQEYQYDEFLEQVIAGKEKNLTIVGEPGAGKSTWLEQIALYVDNSNKGFPICISLASLGGKTLEEYLFQIWLKKALLISPCDESITSAQKQLEELFKSGKVWLLLDGVDEMRADESPLRAIATQLEGWGDLARVVLTCRSNVWEANPNALLNLETYRTLSFDDEQVGDFIQQWFTQEGKPELGEELETKLDEARNDRIQDLIKNPLRLAMLCGIWYFHQGDLPKTKATLYQQYIEYFYRWKQHPQLADDLDKQEELHAAFSKLALEAIDKKLPLRKKFAHKVMGKSLFQLARDVGWLNWVYKDAETGEDVYAFFHLTFQEYFAACAIDDWDFFLNHLPDNPKQGTYRIFEPQWKEVILLWLGREEDNDFSQQKERFIRALMEFKDGCFELIIRNYGFYEYQAYFLAAAGIAEFRECRWADEILKQLLKWGFGTEIQKGSWPDETFKLLVKSGARQTYAPYKIGNKAKEVLLETDRGMAIDGLIELTRNSSVENIRREAVESLGHISKNSPKVKVVLFELMHNSRIDHTSMKAAESLGKIDPGNKQAIAMLLNLIHSSADDYVHSKARLCLGEIAPDHHEAGKLQSSNCFEELVKAGHIDPSNPELIRSLVNEISSTPNKTDKYYSMGVVQSLGHTLPGHPEAIKALINLIDTTVDEDVLREAVGSLGRVGKSDPEAIALLINLIRNSKNESIRYRAVMRLRHTETSYEEAIWMLIDVIGTIPPDFCRMSAAESLAQILQRYPLDSAVSALKNCLFAQVDQQNNLELYSIIYNVLWHCTQNLPYPDFYQAWHQTTNHERG